MAVADLTVPVLPFFFSTRSTSTCCPTTMSCPTKGGSANGSIGRRVYRVHTARVHAARLLGWISA